MIPIDVLIVFFGASLLLALAPGPDNIFVLSQSAIRGASAGFSVTLGLCTGLLVHTSAVALGVAAIFTASALAFTVLKLIGASYLIYLAWCAFRAAPFKTSSKANHDVSLGRLYRRGIIMNITNPKVSIFFLAFLPQFADPARGSVVAQMILLGVVFILSALLVFGAISFLAGALGERLLSSNRAQNILNKTAGLLFAGLALRLALSQR